MRHLILSKALAVLATLGLATFLLFQLVPPVTRADPVGVKLVPASELIDASVEGFDPQNTPLIRRLDLIRQNITALGIGEQLEVRGIILAIIAALALYALLPSRLRPLLPLCDAIDAAAQRFAPYRTFTRLIRHPLFFLVTILLTGGLLVQNELLDTPGSLPALTKLHCSVSQPCNVWSRPFLTDPF
ncbi:hypothetical protein [Methylorubrum sp. DB1722]|jgi:hypothetical protein|nr:hypothetical protein [Methylorubrum sp. DB1722]MBI1692093.1 hypothetical protein [Methylorubrum sp. DB1722]